MLTFLLACPFSLQQEHICVQGAFVHILLDPLQGRETQGCSWKQLQCPNHRGDPTENANTGTGQGEVTLEHQAAPNHGFQSRETPWDEPQFQPVTAGRALQAAACICGCMEITGRRNFGTQSKINCHKGFKPTGLQTKEGWAALRKQESQNPAFYSAPDRSRCHQGADLTPVKGSRRFPLPKVGHGSFPGLPSGFCPWMLGRSSPCDQPRLWVPVTHLRQHRRGTGDSCVPMQLPALPFGVLHSPEQKQNPTKGKTAARTR